MKKHVNMETATLDWVAVGRHARKHDFVGNNLSAREVQTGKDWSPQQWKAHYQKRLKASQDAIERARLHQLILEVDKQISCMEVRKQNYHKRKNNFTQSKHEYDPTKIREGFKQNKRRASNDPAVIADKAAREAKKLAKRAPAQRREEKRMFTAKLSDLVSVYSGSLKGEQFINH